MKKENKYVKNDMKFTDYVCGFNKKRIYGKIEKQNKA